MEDDFGGMGDDPGGEQDMLVSLADGRRSLSPPPLSTQHTTLTTTPPHSSAHHTTTQHKQEGEGGDLGGEGDGVEILQDGEGGASQGQGQQRTGADRITTRYLTKFERARVLGTRALQIR